MQLIFLTTVILLVQTNAHTRDAEVCLDEGELYLGKRVKQSNPVDKALATIARLSKAVDQLEIKVESLIQFRTDIASENCNISCLNGGSCTQTLEGETCICMAGFSGENCDKDIGPHASATLMVSNGIRGGIWSPLEFCPTGSLATGLRIKITSYARDTVGAIQLHCTDVNTGETSIVSSRTAGENKYGEWQNCDPDHYMVEFKMKTEGMDHKVVTGLQITCRGAGLRGEDEVSPEVTSTSHGTWGSESNACPPVQAVCGLSTRLVERDILSYGDYMITDVLFKCCYLHDINPRQSEE